MYSIETEQSFEAAHFLKGYQGKCRNIHGHRWQVQARITAGSLKTDSQTRDMVMDFGDFRSALKQLTDVLDHTLIIEEGSLKEETLAALRAEDFAINQLPFRPTAECLARYFYKGLKDMSIPVDVVTVYETPGNCASYRED